MHQDNGKRRKRHFITWDIIRQPGWDSSNLSHHSGLEERKGVPLQGDPATSRLGPAPPWTSPHEPGDGFPWLLSPFRATATLLLVQHPKDVEMLRYQGTGDAVELAGLDQRGEKPQCYLVGLYLDPAPTGALLGFTWGSTVRRGMEEALPETAWS